MLTIFVILVAMGVGDGQEAIPDGVRGSGTAFVKCGGGFFGGSKRCFEVSLSKLVVQIGEDGTNDDVTVKICSDASSTCCTTPPLKKTFSDDWSSNDLEEWGTRYLGDCAGKKFAVEKGLGVTLTKKGDDTLEVTSLVVEAKSGEDGATVAEKFECGPWSIVGGLSGGGSQLCGTSQYTYEVVKKIIVTMGNEGTNDAVRVDICSDVDDVCCRTKLSSLLSDDWSRNDVETWGASDLDDCGGVKYKVVAGLQLSLVKSGEDDLVVNKVLVDTEDLGGAEHQYDCKGYTLTSKGANCQAGGICEQSRLCSEQGRGQSSVEKQETGKSSKDTTTTATITTTTTTIKPATVSTTVKARPSGGLLAQAGALLAGFGGRKTTTTTTTTSTTTTTTTKRTTRAPFFG